MDHDDDGSGGLDDLSRLFGTGTAPVPATPARIPLEPTGTGEASSPAPAQPAVAPSFGATVPATPVPAGPAAPSDAPSATSPPYSPPPLVPAAPLSGATPPSRPSTSSIPPSPPSAAPARDDGAVIAPAFGGTPVAGRREAPSATVAEPGAPAPVPEPTAAPLWTPPPAPVSEPVGAADAMASVPTTTSALPRSSRAPAAPVAAQPYPGHGPILPGGSVDDIVDDAQVARPTLAEKIFFVLTIVLPPIGLVGTAVAAVGSFRRRGWVIGLLRAGLAIGVVMSVLSAGGAYAGYKAIRQQQAHAQTVAASTAFCAAFAKDKTLGAVDGGWPQPGASVPDSLTAMQAYVDRWNALAKISPEGIQPGVTSVAAAGTEVIKSVQVQRTIDDAQNRPLLVSAVSSAGIANWRANYCE